MSLDNVYYHCSTSSNTAICNDYIVTKILRIIIRTLDENQNNTHAHTLRKNRDVQTARITNDTRRMALELELAGRAVQHTPAASSLYRAVSSALTPSIGQTKQTRLVFRRIFITHQNMTIYVYIYIVYFNNIRCGSVREHVCTLYNTHAYYDQDECAKIVRFTHCFVRA